MMVGIKEKLSTFFMKFCKTCFDHYKGLVKYWLTFNEIDSSFRHPFTTIGLVTDRYPKEKVEEIIFQSLHNQFIASALATKYMREGKARSSNGMYDNKNFNISRKLPS